MGRRKHHGAEPAGQPGGAGLRDAANGGGPPLLDSNRRLLRSIFSGKLQAQRGLVRRKALHFPVPRPPEAPPAGEQPKGLQQIGFSLAIIAVNNIDAL